MGFRNELMVPARPVALEIETMDRINPYRRNGSTVLRAGNSTMNRRAIPRLGLNLGRERG